MEMIHIIFKSTCVEADEYAQELAETFRNYGRIAVPFEHNAIWSNDPKHLRIRAQAITINVTEFDAQHREVNIGDVLENKPNCDWRINVIEIAGYMSALSAKNKFINKRQWAFARCSNCVVETDTPREADENKNIFVVKP